MYRLIFQRDKTRQPFTGNPTELLIGRDPACGLRLAEDGIRDRHASLERRDEGYFLRDLTKGFNVRVNGEAILERRLASGDELEIGSFPLQFEVFEEPPPERRSFDPWQLLAIVIVAALIVGQFGLYIWIFLQPHPHHAQTDIIKKRDTLKQNASTTPVVTNVTLLPLVPTVSVPKQAPVTNPEILSGLLKVIRVDHSDAPDGITIHPLIQSHVGERQLDTAAIAVAIQFFTVPAKPTPLQWLTVPANWENFTSKQFTAHFAGVPSQCAGYVVRTYYRRQLQDRWASTPSLVNASPDPALP